MSGGVPFPSQQLPQAFSTDTSNVSAPGSSVPLTDKVAPFPVTSQIGITPGAMSLADGSVPLNGTPLGSGGVPPWIHDFNGLMYLISGNLLPYVAGQIFPYSSTYATGISGYGLGAIVSDSIGNIWFNYVGGNTSDPTAGNAASPTGWIPLFFPGATLMNIGGLSGTQVLSSVQSGPDVIILTGVLTNDVTLAFPEIERHWTVFNETTGPFNVYAETAAGGSVLVHQGGTASPIGLQTDGTHIWETWPSFTYVDGQLALLAPLSSPALLGVPTAPTAAAGTSTTQLATTAFVANAVGGSAVGGSSFGIVGGSAVVVGTSFTAIVAMAVLPNHTYEVEFNATAVGSAGVGNLSSEITANSGSFTAIGGGLNQVVNLSASSIAQRYGNLCGGVSGWPMYASDTQQLLMRGEFSTTTGQTTATLELEVSAGTLTIDVGSYMKLTLIE